MNLSILENGTKTLLPYLNTYAGYFGMFTAIKPIIKSIKKNISTKYVDVSKIMSCLKEGSIEYGSLIKLNGYMMEYSQLYKPYSHVNGRFKEFVREEDTMKFENGKLVHQQSGRYTFDVVQPPIQKIPQANGIAVAFLYDTRFEGYKHEQNQDKETNRKEPLIINNYSKPIMLLYDPLKSQKCLNKEVEIVARVVKMPESLSAQISSIFDENIKQICSNYIDVYSNNFDFICLSTLEDETQIKCFSKDKKIIDLVTPLYLECEMPSVAHLSGQKQVNDFLIPILPNLPKEKNTNNSFMVSAFNTAGDVGVGYASTNNISIVFREPNIIGFYTTTKLFNAEIYENDLESFSTFVSNFTIDYRNRTQKVFSVKESLELNFIYDYSKQKLFNKNGVLNSNTASQVIRNQNISSHLSDWLRNTP